jgi:hypothetical protein
MIAFKIIECNDLRKYELMRSKTRNYSEIDNHAHRTENQEKFSISLDYY